MFRTAAMQAIRTVIELPQSILFTAVCSRRSQVRLREDGS